MHRTANQSLAIPKKVCWHMQRMHPRWLEVFMFFDIQRLFAQVSFSLTLFVIIVFFILWFLWCSLAFTMNNRQLFDRPVCITFEQLVLQAILSTAAMFFSFGDFKICYVRLLTCFDLRYWVLIFFIAKFCYTLALYNHCNTETLIQSNTKT